MFVQGADIPHYEGELRDRYGFTFTLHCARGAEEILRAGGDEPYDLWFVESRSFGNASFAETERVLTALRQRAPVVFMDSADSAYGRDFGLLHCVDSYVKKQIYRDRGLYQNHYLDGRVFADFLTRANHPKRLLANRRFYLAHWSDGEMFLRFLARSLRKNLAGSAYYGRSTLDPGEAHKLILGWTIGTQGRLYKRFRDQGFQHARSVSRPIDVHCRVTTKAGFFCDWYYYHRQSAIDAPQPMKRTCHVVATSQKLPRDQ